MHTREIVKGSEADGSALKLSFDPPRTTNGESLDKIMVEFDVTQGLNGTEHQTVTLAQRDLLYEIQKVRLSSRKSCSEDANKPCDADGDCSGTCNGGQGGTYKLMYGADDKQTSTIPFDASAAQMRDAVESLEDVFAVEVNRDDTTGATNGYTYRVTFRNYAGRGTGAGPQPLIAREHQLTPSDAVIEIDQVGAFGDIHVTWRADADPADVELVDAYEG